MKALSILRVIHFASTLQFLPRKSYLFCFVFLHFVFRGPDVFIADLEQNSPTALDLLYTNQALTPCPEGSNFEDERKLSHCFNGVARPLGNIGKPKDGKHLGCRTTGKT